MQFSVNPAGLQGWDGTTLALGIVTTSFDEQLNLIEPLFQGSITETLKEKNFSGKEGSIETFQLISKQIKKLILVGLGNKDSLNLDTLRKASAKIARSSIGSPGELGVLFPWEYFEQQDAACAVSEAIRLSLFKDKRFNNNSEPTIRPSSVNLIGLKDSINESLQKVNPICAGVELARELVGSPANELTPTSLAKQALQIAKEYKFKAKVLSQKECQELGMGAYLAVSKGSDIPPQFIHLVYSPEGKAKHRVALVGKGLTFDSGGYNLKVGAAQIDLMKFDMGGSATVLGTARSIGELRPKDIEIHFIIAACENMINGSAVHPGDIVKASNGKTIEINNTDAEGRLTLADALVYTSKLKPEIIIDLATLTGACVIALGDEIAGLWTDDDQLAQKLKNAAAASGEGLWRMPMQNSYKDGLKSLLADLKNTGPRAGGSITAALFLKEFVESSIAWAHIDIAGTVWTEKEKGLNPPGATGYGVRTLVNWLENGFKD